MPVTCWLAVCVMLAVPDALCEVACEPLEVWLRVCDVDCESDAVVVSDAVPELEEVCVDDAVVVWLGVDDWVPVWVLVRDVVLLGDADCAWLGDGVALEVGVELCDGDTESVLDCVVLLVRLCEGDSTWLREDVIDSDGACEGDCV